MSGLRKIPKVGKLLGGPLPRLQLKTRLITVSSKRLAAEQIELRLLTAVTPVIGRISKGVYLLYQNNLR